MIRIRRVPDDLAAANAAAVAQVQTILREQFPSFGFVPVSNEALLGDTDIVSLFPSTFAGVPTLQPVFEKEMN